MEILGTEAWAEIRKDKGQGGAPLPALGRKGQGAGRGKSIVCEHKLLPGQGGVGKKGPNLRLSPPSITLPVPPIGRIHREASWEGRPGVWTAEVSLAEHRAEQTVRGGGGLQLENQFVQ